MLIVKLLGQFNVQLNDLPIEIPSRPAQTLFAFLALQPGTAFRREKLAGLIWPDANESNARSNLRHALWRIRKALGEERGQDYFPADDLTLAFNPAPGCWIDAVVVSNKNGPASPALEEQVAAYQGELLPGFYDDWITVERERLQASFESKIETLLDRLSREKRWAEVIEWAEHWIRFSAAPEPAYRALMLAHARSGHKAKAKEAYQRCVTALQREYGVEPSEETQALYQQLLATRPLAKPSAIEPAAAPRHNLPTPATPLVGREAELAEITDRLANAPSCRLLTIVGPGGIGKTRLALQAAIESLEQFADGTFFVSFESITAAEAMAPAILHTLSSALQDQKDPRAQLMDYVRDKHLLLVLDNLEHLLEGTALIGELLAAAPAIKIIVTSRERLHLQWEWLYEAHGLAYPTDNAEHVESFSAVQLFQQTARRVRARFALAEEQQHVIRICQLVEGLPLGLELAASWVRVMSCREIAEQIERNLDVLSAQLTDMPDRHRSARAVFEYSWSLLAPEEQQVFMRLAAFPGGFRREAAEKVAGAPLSLLFTLVDKSLLRASATGRYDLHNLLHQFVAEKAAQSSQAAVLQTRLLDYYLDYARQHQHDYAALEEERSNLMTCLETARNNWQAQIVLDYVEALGEMWSVRGHWSDARKGYDWACDAARAHDDDQALASYSQRWGQACIEQGDYQEAQTHLEESLQLNQLQGNDRLAAFTMCDLARIAIEKSDLEKATVLLGHCQTIFENLQDGEGMSEVLYRQAWIFYYRHQDEQAYQAAQQALQTEESLNNSRHCIRILCLLADVVAYGRNDYDEAEQYGLRAQKLCAELHDEAYHFTVLAHLADIHRLQGKLTEARHEAEQGYLLCTQMGDRKSQAQFLYRLSRIDYDNGLYDQAVRESQQSLKLCRQLGDKLGEVHIQDYLGQIFHKLGQEPEARQNWSEALLLAQALHHPLAETLRYRLGMEANSG
jgi:predicted ATPase/DNA-binding SARP family transcriptional activator